MQKITRQRALELAQECILDSMKRIYPSIPKWESGKPLDNHYAELAAALAYIETLARQKELL